MPFVIQSTTTFTSKKTGLPVEMIGYFQYHSSRVFAFNSMTSKIEEAAKFETSTEAHRVKRKFFGNEKRVKVVNTEALTSAKP